MTSGQHQSSVTADGESYRFDDFELRIATFELLRAGNPVGLEPQVFSLLAFLIQNHDRLVTKDELLDELWGHRFVSESALTTQVKSLRKAVNDDGRNQRVIKTVHGKGYRFVAELKQAGAVSAPSIVEVPTIQTPANNLPRERSALLGRSADLNALHSIVERNRLVSILGIGGTGKTRMAIALGRKLLEQFPDGVWFVDLIPASEGEAIDDAIANVTRLALSEGNVRRQVVESFSERQMLVILDNCEHIKEEVADAIDFFLEHTRAPKFLLTSRDPVNLADERRYFLPPLSTDSSHDVSPAAQLFIATAERHGVNELSLDLSLIDAICRQLDGLPLAIELAAAQLRYLSLQELAARLNNRFKLLSGGDRTQTLRRANLGAVLNDTWNLLGDQEQQLLGQLSAFPSQFTMDDVESLLDLDSLETLPENMSRLVELSLLSRGTKNWWRLLETVREFTRSHIDADLANQYADRHAAWCLRQLGDYPGDQLDNLSQAQWCLEHYDDLDAAEAHFARNGDTVNAMSVCCSTGLMIQLDDGARSRQKLAQAKHYLTKAPTPYWRARLNAIAALCGQGIRSPELLLTHTETYLDIARTLDDKPLIANALIMQSLTTVFVDRDLALAQIDDAISLGQQAGSTSTVMSASCFKAWHLAMAKEYDTAVQLALELIETEALEPGNADNPSYNATGTIVACDVLRDKAHAVKWSARFAEFPAVSDFWVIQLLQACVAAVDNRPRECAAACLAVRAKLKRAGKDEFPDVAVPAAVLAWSAGEPRQAARWLTTIRDSKRTIQTYHMIIIYRQLYELIGFESNSASPVDEVRDEIVTYLGDVSMLE